MAGNYTPLSQTVDEQLFRLLVASVNDCAIFMIDPNGYIMSWNKGAENIKGYKEEEIIGEHISLFYPPADIKNNVPRNNLNEALKKGTHYDEGYRVKKDGSMFWASVSFTTIYNENGHLVGFAKVTRDITKDKAIEDKKTKNNIELERRLHVNSTRIIANELRFRKLIENSYDGITLLDEEFRISFRSLSSERINGWNAIERAHFTHLALTHPDDRQQVKDLIAEVLSKPYVPILATYRTRHKLGHYIWIECVYTNMLNDININAIVCNFRDITEKKLADEEIRRKSEQIESIFERITDGFIALDNNFCYTYANKQIGKMLGVQPESLIGKYIWDLYPDAIGSETYKAYNKALNEQVYVCQEDYYAPLNFWLENHAYPSSTGLSVFVRDISERKKSELKLAQSEQRFRELLEHSSDIVVVTAFDGTITYISPNAEKTLGYDIQKLSLEQRADMLHPDDKEPYRRLFVEARDNPGKIYDFTYRIKNAAGQYLWIEGTVINLLNVPAVNGLVTNSRDVTDRKNKERQIEASHIQIRQAAETQESILNALPSDIVLINEKYKIVAVNRSWKSMLLANNLGVPNFGIGYSYLAIAEKAAGIDKASANELTKGIRDVIDGQKKQFLIEYRSVNPGERRWYLIIVAPLDDNDEKGAVISHSDITARKLAEELQTKSEDNLRSVFENTDLSIVLFDSDLKIISFNNNAKHLSLRNYRKKLKAGNTAFNYFPKRSKTDIKHILERVRQNDIVSYETTFDVDGNTEWYDVKWVSVTNQQMENVGYILTLKDITAKKRAEIEREQITADLLKRNNDLEQYAYIVSHNLRAPVANIMGLSGLLNALSGTELADRETLDALSTSINNLDKVIGDLNQILQVGSQVNNPTEVVSLSELVDDVKAGNRLIVVTNNASINCNFDAISKITTVKSYLYGIFQSLITNSIKYRRPDADPVINISSEVNGPAVLIRFEDNGKGIDLNKHHAHLFGLYRRFDDQVDGRGIGLFMVKMQVENLGGRVNVQSKPGVGTTFTVELPLN
ncbi:hypothetical protein BEL04_13615 [Mucilaginibacter sp. PPCGB 2223]|uniref:PAS domain-containing sensor histidine kinase n=1 Tax=Mucilaginibacter sp. PPCGB 2223 TaxID=1886027 RepID=UPI00082598D0|nr:PAS domain-containing sensor histidine kinase [Mucilaginibacter sp. PPCGB 2223]OCX52495.1 hypothetical protein BEL04_13615 [Mucilaginibacter sp. PPCGB 2223]